MSGIIAAGIVPAALEMMDAEITRAVEDYVGAGYPRDAGAVLLVEVDGLEAGVAAPGRGRSGRSASSTAPARCASRPTRPSARCSGRDASRRSAPSPGSPPTTTCTTRSCPRTKLVDVLQPGLRDRRRAAAHHDERVPRRRRQPAPAHRLRRAASRGSGTGCTDAGDEILAACVDAGGVLSGEHGIGLEKRDAMPLVFGPDDLDAQARLPRRVRPVGARQPATRSCRGAAAAASSRGSRRARGSDGARARRSATCRSRRPTRSSPSARGTHWEVGGPRRRAGRPVPAPAGIVTYDPADLTVTVGAGHDRRRARRRCSAPHGQECVLDPRDPARHGGRRRSPPASRATAACATGRCATACSRCAS